MNNGVYKFRGYYKAFYEGGVIGLYFTYGEAKFEYYKKSGILLGAEK